MLANVPIENKNQEEIQDKRNSVRVVFSAILSYAVILLITLTTGSITFDQSWIFLPMILSIIYADKWIIRSYKKYIWQSLKSGLLFSVLALLVVAMTAGSSDSADAGVATYLVPILLLLIFISNSIIYKLTKRR